jgi:hypothetical protein
MLKIKIKALFFIKLKRRHLRKREFKILLLNHMIHTPSESLEFAKNGMKEYVDVTYKKNSHIKKITNQ